MGSSKISYFKRFKTEVQKLELELFSNSKYYNKNLHSLVDFMSEFNRDKKPLINEIKDREIFTISDLESEVNFYCSSCNCSAEYKGFCAKNLIASLESSKDIAVLQKIYCNYKCSIAINNLDQNFAIFSLA